MTATEYEFVPLERQLFGLTLGEALASLARQRYPRDTAKHLSRVWDIDPVTAANVIKGHASERTLAKAIKAEGWSLLACLGAAITGETFHQYEERTLELKIKEAEDARENLVRIRSRRQALEQRAGSLGDLRGRKGSERHG
jgi:hypothetical protein